jgi:hypothetical protein
MFGTICHRTRWSLGARIPTVSFCLVALAAAAACGSAPPSPAATMIGPSGTPTATSAATPALETPTPTVGPTKGTPPPSTATPSTAIATPHLLPNLVPGAPSFSPAAPVCNVNFVVSVEVGNKGLGPVLGASEVVVTAVRTRDGWIGLKELMTVEALPAGTSVTASKSVRITRAGSYDIRIEVDAKHWFAESHEDDNVVNTTLGVSIGTCPKT